MQRLFVIILGSVASVFSAAEPISFAISNSPIAVLEAHCLDCHDAEKQKGKVTLHNVDGGLEAGKSLERWELILEVLESGEMPPEEETERPDAAPFHFSSTANPFSRRSVKFAGKISYCSALFFKS